MMLISLLYPIALCAAPDADKSYFTVSTHQPGIDKPVILNVYLRDASGKSLDASDIVLVPGKITKRIKTGQYQGEITLNKVGEKVTPSVMADGIKILENILPGGGDLTNITPWTNDVNKAALERIGNKGLRIITFSLRIGASWGFGEISDKMLLYDRAYLLSAQVETHDIGNGSGAALNFGQRDASGKWVVSGHYSKFLRNGSTREFLSRAFRPVPAAKSVVFGVVLNNAEGCAYFSNPRLQIIPTLIVQPGEGIKISIKQEQGGERVTENYRPAIQDYSARLNEIVKRLSSKFGGNFASKELKNLLREKHSCLNAEDAFQLKLEISKMIKNLEKEELEAERKRLATGFLIAPPRFWASGVHAMIATRGYPQKYYSNFNLLKPEKQKPQRCPSIAAGYDETNLYVNVKVPGKVKVVKSNGKHDDASLWKNSDVVELFIGKKGSRGYCQFAVGPGGQKYDEADGDAFVNFPWNCKVESGADGWSANFSIPWKSLDMRPERNLEFRMNCAVSSYSASKEIYCWSLDNYGFREYESMGFVVLDSFPANVDNYVAYKNKQIKAEYQQSLKRAEKDAAFLKNNSKQSLISFNWDENKDFEKDPAFQMRHIVKQLESPEPAALDFKQAVNEFAHKSFIVASCQEQNKITFSPEDLVSANGQKIPAANLSVYKIGFLEPHPDIWPKFAQKWSGNPLPELVEKVEETVELKPFSASQFRLYIDSRGVKPGVYRGSIGISGKVKVPVECTIMDFALPPCEKQPVSIWIFSDLPWGGASGDAWGRFFQQHYVTDVSMEHPRISVDGEPVKDIRCGGNWAGYTQKALNYRTPEGAKVEIDGSRFDFDDRIRICAKYNLRIILSNRNGWMYPDHIPYLLRHINKLGFKDKNFVYKLGDEDNSPHFLPVAQKIRSLAPDIQVTMIPSGNSYWDLTQLLDGFTCMDYSRAAMTINKQGEKDLKAMRAKGFPIRRYTNRTSWAERCPRLSGRYDLWDTVIREGLDGLVVWTTGVKPQDGYSLGYGSVRHFDWASLPPENQHQCQLTYYRKCGDFYKPVSCIRLEDMRDGVTDVLYYREARKRINGNPSKLAALAEIVKRGKTSKDDYDKARADMAKLILE